MSVSSIDPIAFEIGPLVFRWYALAYVVGLLAGWWHVIVLVKTGRVHFPLKVVDDLFLFIVLGIIVGGAQDVPPSGGRCWRRLAPR